MKLSDKLNDIVVDLICEKQTTKSLTNHILVILEELERNGHSAKTQEAVVKGARNYGPKSTRKMTREDAWDILFGPYKECSVNEIASTLGLSRGQVYSLKGNYTFRDVTFEEFEYQFNEKTGHLVRI